MNEHERLVWLEQKLSQAFAPTYLDIEDESYLHVGHAGNQGGGHYAVHIVSEAFADYSLLARHRLVYDVLVEGMGGEIHALRLKTQTIAEQS